MFGDNIQIKDALGFLHMVLAFIGVEKHGRLFIIDHMP